MMMSKLSILRELTNLKLVKDRFSIYKIIIIMIPVIIIIGRVIIMITTMTKITTI